MPLYVYMIIHMSVNTNWAHCIHMFIHMSVNTNWAHCIHMIIHMSVNTNWAHCMLVMHYVAAVEMVHYDNQYAWMKRV